MIHILCFSNMVSLLVSLKLGAHSKFFFAEEGVEPEEKSFMIKTLENAIFSADTKKIQSIKSME